MIPGEYTHMGNILGVIMGDIIRLENESSQSFSHFQPEI